MLGADKRVMIKNISAWKISSLNELSKERQRVCERSMHSNTFFNSIISEFETK